MFNFDQEKKKLNLNDICFENENVKCVKAIHVCLINYGLDLHVCSYCNDLFLRKQFAVK